MSLLELESLKVSYGGIEAVSDLSMSIGQGELVALIGANGAGKSTTLRALCGLVIPESGAIRFNGDNISGTATHLIARRGIALVPEGRGIFTRLSVAENLAMGAFMRNDRPAIKQDTDRIYQLFPRLAERRTQRAGTLSGGEQQMLAIGRAVLSRPALLLLDEPSMGLAPLMVTKIFETIQAISSEGVTILLVEQNAKLALRVSRRAYVLESGRVVLAGDSHELMHNDQVRHAYLGE